ANAAAYVPYPNIAGTPVADSAYYYVVVNNFNIPEGSFAKYTTSNVSGNILVYSPPVINTELDTSSRTYCQFNAANTIGVSATPGAYGNLSYLWYTNNTNSYNGATLITTASAYNTASIIPPTNNSGTLFYFVRVFNGGPAACGYDTSLRKQITVNPGPTITQNLSTNTIPYCKNQPISPTQLSVNANTGVMNNNVTVQWYYKTTAPTDPNSDYSNATAVPMPSDGNGSTTTSNLANGDVFANLIPRWDIVSNRYYFATLTNTSNGVSCSVNSTITGLVGIYAYPDTGTSPAPQLAGANYCFNVGGAITPLSLSGASTENGTTIHQWYRNPNANTTIDASNGVAINASFGSTNASFSPIRDSGTSYYFDVLTNLANPVCSTKSRVSGPIRIFDFPIITSNISTSNTVADYCRNQSLGVNNLTIAARNRANLGVLNYIWNRSLVSTGNNPDTSSFTQPRINSYRPSVANTGVNYYFVVVDNQGPSACRYSTSQVSGAISVYAAPTITVQPSSAVRVYCQFQTGVTPLSVQANNTGLGTIVYSWFRNTTPVNSGGTPLTAPSEIDTTYLPDAAVIGTNYYYAIVTNNNAPLACNTTISTISGRIQVNAGAQIVNPQNFGQPFKYCKNQTGAVQNLSVDPQPSVTYQWYANRTPDTAGAWRIAGSAGQSNSYSPNLDTVNTRYYYVVLTSNLGASCPSTSEVSQSVGIYSYPQITTASVSLNAANYCQGQVSGITALNVPATNEGGASITYFWYRDTLQRQTSTNAFQTNVNVSSTFPIVTTPSAFYYYTILKNTDYDVCQTTSDLSGLITVFRVPNITSQPSPAGGSVCINNNFNLTVGANLTNNIGSIRYNWFRSTSPQRANSVAVPNSNLSSIDVLEDTSGYYYYYVVVNNGGPATCASTTSNVTGQYALYGTPTVTIPNGSATVCQFTNVANIPQVTVTPTTGGIGTQTLQWFVANAFSSPGSGGTAIPNANSNSYQPNAETQGSFFYYITVSNGGPAGCNIVTSSTSGLYLVNGSARITVEPQALPAIVNYCQNTLSPLAGVTPLTIAADGNSLTYTWYKTSQATPTGGFSVATGETYTPRIDTASAVYYYVIVSNTQAGVSCSSTSRISSQIRVFAKPQINFG
ncbi:MAG: hypothetical protein ORN85_02130, partial [Sediminibacterium sp.]|nr:hypothetical protein [Sediminibacterium sp.]